MNDGSDGTGPGSTRPGGTQGGPGGSSWSPPPPPPPGYAPQPVYAAPPAPAKASSGILTRIVTGLLTSLLLVSIFLNFYLGLYFVSSMRGPQEETYQRGEAQSRIVIVPVNGMIDDSTARAVRQSLEALRQNLPKAIILRVDSGGGGVSPSDRIWHELKRFKKEHPDIPIIASFGSVAASGGYYISADADHILVEPTTITGSIGVIAQAFTVQGLLEKIGVTPEVIAATEATKKDTLSPFRAWGEKDRAELRVILDEAHTRFVDIVAHGRSGVLTREQVAALATGEPYTASQALANKLVDGEGYLIDAIDKAKELAKLPADAKPTVTVISPPRSLGLLGLLGGTTSAPSADQLLDAQRLRKVAGELSMPRLEYTATMR